ncbi:MAG: hypothetical protein ACLPZY_09555, partial [Terracidiphilus sp.]
MLWKSGPQFVAQREQSAEKSEPQIPPRTKVLVGMAKIKQLNAALKRRTTRAKHCTELFSKRPKAKLRFEATPDSISKNAYFRP